MHHQSEDYNLSTALRQTSTGFLFGWVFYLPLFLIGFPLEIVLTVNAVNLLYQFWVHTQLIRSLGPLERVMMTPSHHRVHHAQNERYIDKNYGGMFIIWDRMFGTYEPESDEEPVIFGVRKPLESWNPFWANLQVYDYLLFDARKAKRWQDKIGVWFRRTGWRPADVEEAYPKRSSDLQRFEKFDPPIATTISRYAIAQFVVAIIVILWIGDVYAKQGARAVLIPCIGLWLLLLSLGLLNEGRASARALEFLRLFVVVPLLLWLLNMSVTTVSTVAWLLTAAYVLGSAMWLAFSPKKELINA